MKALGIETSTADNPTICKVKGSKKSERHYLAGIHKIVFLKTKRTALTIVSNEDQEINLKELYKTKGSAKLSSCKPELFIKTLGLIPQLVEAFGSINDRRNYITPALDKKLIKFGSLDFHLMTNAVDTLISPSRLWRSTED